MDAHYRSYNSLWYCWTFFALFAILAQAACLKYALKRAWPHFIALSWAERIHMFMSEVFQKARSFITEKIFNFWLVPSARDFYFYILTCLLRCQFKALRIHKHLLYSSHKPLTFYSWRSSVRCSLEKNWEKRSFYIKAKFQISEFSRHKFSKKMYLFPSTGAYFKYWMIQQTFTDSF